MMISSTGFVVLLTATTSTGASLKNSLTFFKSSLFDSTSAITIA